jgi:hypothetical protein
MLNDARHLDAPSRKIAADFFDSHESEIPKDAWREVTIDGLVHMLDGLRRRRRAPSGTAIAALDLFSGFDVDPIVVVRTTEEGKGVVEKNKDVASVTLPEALDYLARYTQERETNTKKAREWRRLIARVRPYMTKDGMTLGEAMKLAQAAEAKKKPGSGKP